MNSQQWLGGQAVLEGVMMRSQNEMVIACRNPGGEIVIHREEVSTLARRYPFLRWPFLRGVVAFVEALSLGIKALNISTETALEEEGEDLPPAYTILTVVLGLALGVALFFLLPTYIANFLPEINPVAANLVEGFLRILIFISYIFLISRWGEIKRFFAYHGAEHKAIFCFEDGRSLEVNNTLDFDTRHPRCGTSFLLIVMLVSVILFSFFGWPGIWERFLIRICMLPVVAAVAYELIRLTARASFKPLKVLSLPGLWLQYLTTREPDASQLEVALEAVKSLVGGENSEDDSGAGSKESEAEKDPTSAAVDS